MTYPPLEFDEYGFLQPAQPIVTDLQTFQHVFVDSLTESITRLPLFQAYKTYCEHLKALVPEGFTQWIDGSFVSRKLNPNDIDVVTFVDAALYAKQERAFSQLREWRFRKPKQIDGYFVPVYSQAHKHRVLYESDRAQ